MNLPLILFFIDDCSPTEKELEQANSIKNAKVVFRNASCVPTEPHALEVCDGVAGCVPELYAEKYKTADVAVIESNVVIEKLQKLTGDEKAPKVDKTKAPVAPWGNK